MTSPASDPHATVFAVCDRGHTFEDLAQAVDANGGWCPVCDAPARRRLDQTEVDAILDAELVQVVQDRRETQRSESGHPWGDPEVDASRPWNTPR